MSFVLAVVILSMIASGMGAATGLILLGVRLGRLTGNNLDAPSRIVVRGDIRNEAMIAAALAIELYISLSILQTGPGNANRVAANCVITSILCVNQALNFRDYRRLMALIDQGDPHHAA